MKPVTIADVAKHANVSKSTISQYLNKRFEYMSEKTRKKIETSIEELKYKPNFLARSLKQKSTFTVGVIVANILHTLSTHIIRAIETYFHQHGFQIIICNADDEPEKEKKYIEMLQAKQVDGIIIFPTGGNIELYQEMKQNQFPLVFMDRRVSDLDITTVMLDNHLAAKLAIDQFLENGYKNIAIITTSIIRHISPRIERIEGYKASLYANGIEVNRDYIKTADPNEISAAVAELLALETPPNAIFAGNDIVLLEILKYFKEQNIRIPDDVAIISIDDVPFASLYSPPITTISQPAIEMANLAVELLLQQINKEENENEQTLYRLEPSLIVRNSC